MRFVEEQQKTRLPWKYSQSHLSHSLLYGFSTERELFISSITKQWHWLWVFALAFAVDVCFGLPPNESCYDAIKMRNHLSLCLQLQELSPFPKISRRVPRCWFFNDTLTFFVYVDETFLWEIRKIVLITLWLYVLFVMSGFTKNAWALAKKSFLQKMNIKNGNVVTANFNVYNKTLHL